MFTLNFGVMASSIVATERMKWTARRWSVHPTNGTAPIFAFVFLKGGSATVSRTVLMVRTKLTVHNLRNHRKYQALMSLIPDVVVSAR